MDVPAAAVRTFHFCFVDVGDVVVLRKFLIAVLTMKGVLRHSLLRGNRIAPIFVEGC